MVQGVFLSLPLYVCYQFITLILYSHHISESDEGMGFEQASKSAGKRPLTSSLRSSNVNAKRGRKSSSSDALPSLEPVYIKEEPVERPDAHLCLKVYQVHLLFKILLT